MWRAGRRLAARSIRSESEAECLHHLSYSSDELAMAPMSVSTTLPTGMKFDCTATQR
ncbi:Uncharacterised protein [Mycobacteroides abscessus subsp. abscessus]|nr:Uncharacterised protein [Mycobacteroides abscessus subsp. abscessus]